MTSVLDQSDVVAVESPRWDLAPSVARVEAVDRALRLRLVDSLNYLGEVAALDAAHQAALTSVVQRLEAGRVSPWVFCLYSKLVAELSKNPRGNVGALFADIAHAATLPSDEGVVAFRNPAAPASWWDHFQLLLDTDRQRPFRPKAPAQEDFTRCAADVEAGLAVLEAGDPVWQREVRTLVRMIVLAAPKSADVADLFNGASTFFLWGASLLNANFRRTSLSIVDLLVHESSHVLLFGVSADGALTTNSGHERYDSPLRSDKRPIDGIFHACFVATRVHLAMERLIQSGTLREANIKLARDRQQHNGSAARAALEVLDRHARPTELGEKILGTLRAYWAGIPSD